MIAVGIEDFQISRSGDEIGIDITGKAAVQDRNFRDGTDGTKYRTANMASSVVPRNTGL
jgi:hypothetical protein